MLVVVFPSLRYCVRVVSPGTAAAAAPPPRLISLVVVYESARMTMRVDMISRPTTAMIVRVACGDIKGNDLRGVLLRHGRGERGGSA